MTDPHVSALIYSISSDESVQYLDPPPLELSLPEGRLRLEGMKLRFEPSSHFARVSEARDAIEPVLRAYEVGVDLQQGNPGTIRFTFADAEVIDRDPSPMHVIHVEAGIFCISTATATLTVGRKTYPSPTAFLLTRDVEVAHARWARYREGRETLTGVAYFVFTVLLDTKGPNGQALKKAGAPKHFNIHQNVLSTLSRLSSTAGGQDARKAEGIGVELTAQESQWLTQALPRLIHRLGERAASSSLCEIGMTDFPALGP